MNIETALTFENTDDGSTLQVEKDTSGYSMTIFDADGDIATMALDGPVIARLINFLTNIQNTETN